MSKLRLDVVTIFPEYLDPLRHALLGKAIEQGILSVGVHDLRDWATGNHKSVDSPPLGGGPGMVMLPEVWGNALDEIAAGLTEPEVERLVAIIKSVKADHAMIWIEHIPHALRAVSDRILVLDFGRKVLEGPPAEVMDSAVVREIYMGLKADGVA